MARGRNPTPGYTFPECGCKYVTAEAYVPPRDKRLKGEEPYAPGSAIICNTWQAEHHCDRCGWNPEVAKERLLRLYGYNQV